MGKAKWLLKACPRSGGFTCLQCGHRVEVRHELNKRTTRLPVGTAGRS